ncbi:MAG TPA: hypothetical protein DHV62_01280 [Elusimicrobia bacterium]|nr:hypothetical protein [Elusimicrobiota bacterium]
MFPQSFQKFFNFAFAKNGFHFFSSLRLDFFSLNIKNLEQLSFHLPDSVGEKCLSISLQYCLWQNYEISSPISKKFLEKEYWKRHPGKCPIKISVVGKEKGRYYSMTKTAKLV